MSQKAPCTDEHDASVGYSTPSSLALTGQVAQERSLLPPIERIPMEILDTIFTSIHESYEYSLTIHGSIVFSLFLSLSQVCSRWRTAILSRPILWASISIDADYVEVESRNIVNAHLRNAGSHPLRIKLTAYPSSIASRATFGDNILRMIVPELRRCKKLVFRGELAELAQVAPFQCSFTLPHLRSLNVDTFLSAWTEGMGLVPPTLRWFSRALKTAPKLTKVSTTDNISTNVLPCHQLMTVCVCGSRLKVAEVAHILRSCPNLKNLKVDTLVPDPGPLPNVVVHSSLQELTIRTNPDWLIEVAGSLARLSFPALQMFKLRLDGPDQTAATSAVIAVIQCFSAPLRTLVLVTWSRVMYRTLCTDILRVCPNLCCFVVEVSTHIKDDRGPEYILHLIQNLMITDTSQAFLVPKLKKLCLHAYMTHMTPDYATAFLDMVESRSAGIGVTRLMDVELGYTPGWGVRPESDCLDKCISDSSIVERIKVLSRKGIHCAIGAIRG